MIKFEELNPKNFKMTEEQKQNLIVLCEKMNKIRNLYGKPMVITSGLRDIEDHKRIYRAKGITDESKIPMASKHLYGQACDVSDPNGELAKWCHTNEEKLKEIGVWCENGTIGWVHFQIVKYGSYKTGKSIFFNP